MVLRYQDTHRAAVDTAVAELQASRAPLGGRVLANLASCHQPLPSRAAAVIAALGLPGPSVELPARPADDEDLAPPSGNAHADRAERAVSLDPRPHAAPVAGLPPASGHRPPSRPTALSTDEAPAGPADIQDAVMHHVHVLANAATHGAPTPPIGEPRRTINHVDSQRKSATPREDCSPRRGPYLSILRRISVGVARSSRTPQPLGART
jgi:hypothetical protein